MDKQRGGRFTVKGWLALLLLTLAVGEACEIWYLNTHRTINLLIVEPAQPPTQVALPPTTITPDEDYYVTHIWPEGQAVCTAFDNICYITI